VSAKERSGWRDQEISLRHRKWGFDCCATDLDFLMLEFNHGIPVALVDYKHHKKPDPLDGMHKNAIKAMSSLRDDLGQSIPFLIARYWPEPDRDWAFEALPMNDAAREWITEDDWRPMTEVRWVRGLYAMRKLAIDIRDRNLLVDSTGRACRLGTTLPPVEETMKGRSVTGQAAA
jgi:hypothetical protein